MKEFVSAVEEVTEEDLAKRETEIEALIASGLSREDAELQLDRGVPVTFKMDAREMRAYPPSDGQLVFMLANLGRGQTKEGRFASIVNVMMESLHPDDQDYFESRLLTGDPKQRVQMPMLEQIFEYLVGEWFATERPTPPSSGSV